MTAMIALSGRLLDSLPGTDACVTLNAEENCAACTGWFAKKRMARLQQLPRRPRIVAEMDLADALILDTFAGLVLPKTLKRKRFMARICSATGTRTE